MKKIWIAGVLFAASALHATTLTNPIDDLFNAPNATATYRVISNGSGVTSQGFIGPSTYSSVATWILEFDPLPAGATLNYANLTITSSAPGPFVPPSSATLSAIEDRTHFVGTVPLFDAAPSLALGTTITGALGGSQTLTTLTGFDLSSFRNDIIAGNDLTIQVTASAAFSTTRLASDSPDKWKNETATYNLSQALGSFTASGRVDYTTASQPPAVPEPVSMTLSGAGLVLLGIFKKKRNRAA